MKRFTGFRAQFFDWKTKKALAVKMTSFNDNNNNNNNNSIYLSTINYNAAKLMWSCQLKYPNTPIPTPITYAPKSLS